MNGDRPPLGTNNGGYSQQTSIVDALLLDQIARQQQLQHHADLRARLLASTNTTGISSSSSSSSSTAAAAPGLFTRTPGAWTLPPLPRNGANLTTAALHGMNLQEDSRRVLVQMLHRQQLAASLRDSEKAHMLSGRLPVGQDFVSGQSSVTSSLALAAAMQSERMASGLTVKKRSHDDTSNQIGTRNSFPGPSKKKCLSPDVTIMPTLPSKNGGSSAAASFFPLPNKDREPKQDTPNLISFQRTWGKLEKCRMRTELFRRKLERGEVQLTGVTRSVLYQAKQQHQHQHQQTQQQQQKRPSPKKNTKQGREKTKRKHPTSGEKKKNDKDAS